MHRGKVDPGVSELPRGNELSRVHVNRPLDSLHDNVTDTDDNSDLVADVDPDTFIRIVRTRAKKWFGSRYRQCLQRHSQEGNRYRFSQTFGSSLYHIIKTRFYSICLEGSSPLYVHQT